jgi:hypothetical protein
MRVVAARFTLLIGIVLAASPILPARELDQETSKAWNEYIQSANLNMQRRAAGAAPFLWIDEAPGRREAVRGGEVLVEPTQKESPAKLMRGLVFDWTGAAFFPNTTIRHIFRVLNEFDRYDEFYCPAVLNAKLLDETENSARFSIVVSDKTAFVDTVIESEYSSETTCLDARHCYNIIYSTRIQQIENYNSPREYKLPPDQGFLWRLYSIQRYEERDGGVYAELESIALSRDVPFELRWLMKPILRHLPRNSMIGTLEKTRSAVCANGKPSPADQPPGKNEAELSRLQRMPPAQTSDRKLRPEAEQR